MVMAFSMSRPGRRHSQRHSFGAAEKNRGDMRPSGNGTCTPAPRSSSSSSIVAGGGSSGGGNMFGLGRRAAKIMQQRKVDESPQSKQSSMVSDTMTSKTSMVTPSPPRRSTTSNSSPTTKRKKKKRKLTLPFRGLSFSSKKSKAAVLLIEDVSDHDGTVDFEPLHNSSNEDQDENSGSFLRPPSRTSLTPETKSSQTPPPPPPPQDDERSKGSFTQFSNSVFHSLEDFQDVEDFNNSINQSDTNDNDDDMDCIDFSETAASTSPSSTNCLFQDANELKEKYIESLLGDSNQPTTYLSPTALPSRLSVLPLGSSRSSASQDFPSDLDTSAFGFFAPPQGRNKKPRSPLGPRKISFEYPTYTDEAVYFDDINDLFGSGTFPDDEPPQEPAVTAVSTTVTKFNGSWDEPPTSQPWVRERNDSEIEISLVSDDKPFSALDQLQPKTKKSMDSNTTSGGEIHLHPVMSGQVEPQPVTPFSTSSARSAKSMSNVWRQLRSTGDAMYDNLRRISCLTFCHPTDAEKPTRAVRTVTLKNSWIEVPGDGEDDVSRLDDLSYEYCRAQSHERDVGVDSEKYAAPEKTHEAEASDVHRALSTELSQ